MRSIPTQQNTTGTRDGLCRSRGILRPFQRGPMGGSKTAQGRRRELSGGVRSEESRRGSSSPAGPLPFQPIPRSLCVSLRSRYNRTRLVWEVRRTSRAVASLAPPCACSACAACAAR